MSTKFPKIPKSIFRPPPGFKKPKVKDFQKDMQNLGESIAEEFKEKVVHNIETNAYGFTLHPSTIKRKGHGVPLIEDRELIEAIYRDGTSVSVEDSTREDSPITNLDLAMIHEYGTKDLHIPARPVWRKTYSDYRGVAKEKLETFFKNAKKKR